MESADLCETIFQFVGPEEPEHVSTTNLPVPSMKTVRAGQDGGGATAATAASPTHNGQLTTQPLPMKAERSSNTSTSPRHQVENEEIMRAFMGHKLGEYNMRGVEAGMAMLAVDNQSAGKTLHTKSRRQSRVDSRPYGQRPSRDKKGPQR